MNFKEVKCRNCGAKMNVAEDATKIKCDFCGMEYILSDNKPRYNPVKLIDWGGRGVIFKAYIPKDWNYKVTNDGSVSILEPVCKGLQLDSPADQHLSFFPEAYYKNYTPGQNMTGPGTFAKAEDYAVDGWSLVCWRRLVNPQQYAAERLMKIYGNICNLQLSPENDDTLKQQCQSFPNEAARKLERPVSAGLYKYNVSFSAYGRAYKGCFATAIAVTNDAGNDRQVNSGNGFSNMFMGGFGMFGGMMGEAKVKSDWGRAFDIAIAVPAGDSFDCNALLHNFIRELQYGPVYYALQDEELRNANQAEMYGMMTRQQNAIRASQHISQTLSETSNILNSACREHSQQMDRIIDHSSDGIRGVNRFTDYGGNSYQADVAYEHIYRNGDTFVGSKDGSLELGPQWEELKKE